MSVVIFMSLVVPMPAVTCLHCKDTIIGCVGGTACPLVADVAHNRALFEHGTPGDIKVSQLLPVRLLSLFSQSVCKQLIGMSMAPPGGLEVDLTGSDYVRAGDVVRAVFYSHCTPEAGMLELVTRMDGATDADEMTKLKSAIDLLKAKGDVGMTGVAGQFSYIWAKVSNHASSANILRLQAPASRGTSTDLSAKLVPPTTSQEFFEMIHLYIWALVAFGIVQFPIIMQFFDQIVWRPLRDSADITWQTAYALVNVYLKEIETDQSRTLHFGNVYNRGKHDTLLAQAKASVVFFRTRAGTAQTGSSNTAAAAGSASHATWNGKFSAGQRPCYAYNTGKPHNASSLHPDGTCVYDHVCMQFVSDKGKGGQCKGKHPFTACNYDASKKRTTAQP